MHVLSKFSRRSLLGGGAAAAALAPFVPLLDSHAGVDGIPTRVIILYTPTGSVLEHWRPTGTTDDWTLSPILSPLEENKDRIIVLDGIDDEAAHHVTYHTSGWGYGGHQSICSLWTGAAPVTFGEDHYDSGGISIDHYLGDRLQGATPFKTIPFAVRHRQEAYWKNRMSFSGPQASVPAIDDPIAMLEHIYGNLDLDEAALAQQQRSRLSVIDAVAGDLERLTTKMSKGDKIKMDAHLAALREIEILVGTGTIACEPPLATPLVPDWEGMPDNWDNMTELMVRALACDATRVASMMIGWENSDMQFPYLDLGIDDTRLHGMSHESTGPRREGFAGAQQFFAGQFNKLLNRLDAEVEADGTTMLDNTVVVWATTLSEAWRHSSRNIPVVLGGGGGGYFETGRYHRYGAYPVVADNATHAHAAHGGRTMNDVHLSLIHAMGFDEVETFGDPQFCTGPIV